MDAGVLIYAARGQGDISEKALQILKDTEHEFASSIFLKFEVLPKAIYHKQSSDIKFYEYFLNQFLFGQMTSSKSLNLLIEKQGNLSPMKNRKSQFIAQKVFQLSPSILIRQKLRQD